MQDAWGTPTAGDPASVHAWNEAWTEALHFVDDPFATLQSANETDEAFVLGSVFCGTYRLLGGAPPTADEVQTDLQRAQHRARTDREQGHAEALVMLAAHDFTAAARRWDRVARDHRDFAAVRFAHDVYLHVGNAGARLRSSEFAIAMFDGTPGWNFVASQYAFALEEVGLFDEAERVAWEALDADPRDLWATHALAHVYEDTGNQDAALQLLRSRESTWARQDGLAVHIWWHLALRLIAAGSFDEVLDLHDRLVPHATTPFRLCDLTSMLWRLELQGVDVGDRWDHLSGAFAARPEQHTCGFLDLHQAMVHTRRPSRSEAAAFFHGLEQAHVGSDSENSTTFRTVVQPLVQAIRMSEADPAASVAILDQIDPMLHRIGGSNAQRGIVALTRNHLDTTDAHPTVLETT